MRRRSNSKVNYKRFKIKGQPRKKERKRLSNNHHLKIK
jgi:hypothetical protein